MIQIKWWRRGLKADSRQNAEYREETNKFENKAIESVNAIWKALIHRYKQKAQPIPFAFKSIVLDDLGEKRTNNYPHYIHYYPGKILPYIPLFLLSLDRLCPQNGIVLDPFAGSGTVLLESIINPVYKRNVWGVEINPLGRLISKVKTTPLNIEFTRKLSKQISRYYSSLPNNISLPIPKFKNIDIWFFEKAVKELAKLRLSIENLNAEKDYKDFFWLCFSSIIRKVAKADPFIPPPVLLKPYKYKNNHKKYKYVRNFLRNAEDPDVIAIFETVVENNLKSIANLNNVNEPINKKIKAKIIWDDAKDIKFSKLAERGRVIKDSNTHPLDSNSIDLIITSPPYLNAQKYIRTHKLELLWLGIVTEKELLALDKKLIGTEKVSLKQVDFNEQLGIKSIDRLIKWAVIISPIRAALVYNYFQDMRQTISEMYRVLKNNAYAILVVGNNTVLKKKVETYRLLTDLATSMGFREILILKDNIRCRSMITKRHNSGGLIKEEYVIVLKKEKF